MTRCFPLIVTSLRAAVVVVAILGATACGASTDPVAVSVGDVEYRVDDLVSHLAGTVAVDDQSVVARDHAAVWVSDWVYFTAVELEMKDRGVSIDDRHRAEAEAKLASLEDFNPNTPGSDIRIGWEALVLAVLEWVRESIPTDVNLDLLSPDAPRLLCSSHIVVGSEDEANAVLARLGSGESFADLAVELSLDQESASVGGDLGCVIEGTFPEPFEAAAYAAGTGGIGGVFLDPNIHLIQVASAGPITAEAHPQIDSDRLMQLAADATTELQSQADSEADGERQALINDLQQVAIDRYKNQVKVDPRYGTWDAEGFLVVVGDAGADSGIG